MLFRSGALSAMKNTSGLCISRTATRLTRLGKIMAKTLADMTPEERADCMGMWALIEGINLAVIVEVDETDTCVVIYPEWQSNTAVHLNEMVAPRFDLPRAWTPDGEPELAQALAEETWEYSFQILRRDEWEHASDRIPGVDEWFPSKYVADFIMDAAQKSGYVCRLVRRRVSAPEVISE